MLRGLLAASLLVGSISCGDGAEFSRVDGQAFGTYFAVTADCPAAVTRAPIDAVLDRVDRIMSTYRTDSELVALNRQPVDRWLPVDAELHRVLSAALVLSEQSAGAFDVTVGPLVSLWGFGPEARGAVPDPAAVERARDRVGYQHLSLRGDPPALLKARPVEIDLSALAKGYAVDMISEKLTALGCRRHLVDVGGEVRARGRNSTGRWWRIGVERPDPGRTGTIQSVLEARDAAIATSGDYRNFIEVDGRRYSHTIDPATGAPVRHRLASVTVVAETAMWADGYATLLNVLGPDAGPAFARERGLAAYFLLYSATDSSGFETRYTDAIAPLLVSGPGANQPDPT